ncbi:MAG TPA: hypothetical protein VHB79_06575 [Polyangiaceae bacterium]|nr:hypothetical protein [Polyangiaceae bacterium]
MKKLAPFLRLALLLAGPALISVQGCEQEEGFQCGRQVPGTNTIRRCDGANEVCVCATNSCAVRVGILPTSRDGDAGGPPISVEGGGGFDNWGECLGPGETGYRYVDAPFARDGLAGNCVKAVDLRLGPLVQADAPACPGQVFLEPSGGTGNGGAAGAGGLSGAGGVGGVGGIAGMSGSSGADQGGAGAGGMSQGGAGSPAGGQSSGGQNSAGMSGGPQ